MSDPASLIFGLAPHLQHKATRGTDYILIQCPFHGGGQENTPSCSVSLTKPVFFCHACTEAGHLVRLLRQFGLSPQGAQAAIEGAGLDKPTQRAADAAAARYRGGNPYRGEFILSESTLDPYMQAPVDLLKAGFAKQTLRHFEVGYDTQNLRITFPLRNIYGNLVGLSGRAAYDGMEPRYKIYRRELIERPDLNVPDTYSMDSVKESLMWHAHVVKPFLYGHSDEPLIITEGFKACMWVWQAGFPTVVALVGAYLSELHAELIAHTSQNVLLLLDNNPAGWKGTFHAAEKLMKKGVGFKIARYPDDREQPDELDPHEVHEALLNPQSFPEWKVENGRPVHEVAWRRYVRRAVR